MDQKQTARFSLMIGLILLGEVLPAAPAGQPAEPPAAPSRAPVDPAVKETQQRLLDHSHVLIAKSDLAGYPEFTGKDWTGLVLSPKSVGADLGHTRNFRILQIEVHLLNDGRIRVWFELVNIDALKRSITPEAACRFTPEDNENNVKFRTLPILTAGEKMIAYFESRTPTTEIYSLLVREQSDHQ